MVVTVVVAVIAALLTLEVGPWVSVWTLNNRVLYVNTNNVSRVLLVDDDCDLRWTRKTGQLVKWESCS